jgi:hypothetical protein
MSLRGVAKQRRSNLMINLEIASPLRRSLREDAVARNDIIKKVPEYSGTW